MIERITTAEHITLVVHKNPDADSLGAACAFYSHLLRLQKKVTLYCASERINPALGFLPWFDKVTHSFPSDADLMIAFDCGTVERMGVVADAALINFDHHASNTDFGEYNCVNKRALCTTEVVYDFFVAEGIKINGKMALSLYAGLLDDTRCFSHAQCGPKTFQMASNLIELGANHRLCVEWLYGRRSLASQRIRGRLLQGMKLVCDGALAVFDVTVADLESTGAGIGECKQVLEDALSLRTVKAAVMTVSLPKGGTKASIRSDGSVDVSAIASRFGGGGHATRAGIRSQEMSESLAQQLITMIAKEME